MIKKIFASLKRILLSTPFSPPDRREFISVYQPYIDDSPKNGTIKRRTTKKKVSRGTNPKKGKVKKVCKQDS